MATITSTTTTPPAVLSEKLSSTIQKDATPKFSWESGPMQIVSTPILATGATDQYTKVASEMALVHNCIIRAMNSIYIQAPNVPASEHQNFINYALATYRGLCMHHDGEEEVFFPTLEKLTGETGLMDANVQGHRDFDEKLGHWGKWLEACQAKKDTFTADECRRQMDDFMPPLAAHLGDEIPTLLALSRFGDSLDLLQLMKEEGEKIMGSMSKTEILPLFLLNHYDSFEGGIHVFPPLPAPVSWTLRCVFGRWNSAWWQFSTVGYDGLPRELKYAGKK